MATAASPEESTLGAGASKADVFFAKAGWHSVSVMVF